MALKSGTKLGPYEILSQLGAGGMGEVYQARDTRLDRLVAIKILPAHLADLPELRERFEREARALANLKHSNICVLYDIGRQDGTDFLVMEYLEGETLSARLKKGPLPVEQVLQYAAEVSDALDKAHRDGFTHRDIKPGNIMLVPQSGAGPKTSAKVLDFGLAKLKQEVAKATTPASEMPTVQGGLTQHGTLLGTLQYMSPEQIEGKVNEIDHRTDIFAFGAMVYEMGTGKKAFPGETQASVIAKVLEVDPPPMSSLQPPGNMVPPALDRVVKRCLAKDREDRWQSMRDLCHELTWIRKGGGEAAAPPAPEVGRTVPLRRWALVAGLALLIGAVVSGLAVWTLKPAPPQPVTRTVIALPPGQRLAQLDRPAVAISPDGSQVVYVASEGGVQQLYLRPMDSLESRAIPGTEGAVNPVFSPDGQWVGFSFVGGVLKKVSVSGGPAVTLASIGLAQGVSWGSQSIAYVPNTTAPLLRVPEEGGAPQELTRFATGEFTHRWPFFLPGGNALLFAVSLNVVDWSNAQIAVHSLETGERRDLIQGGMQPAYAASGHLLYATAGSLMAVPFDPRRLDVTGPAVPVLESVMQSPSNGAAQYSLSTTGTLVYVPGGGIEAAQSELVWVDRRGAEQLINAPARPYYGNPRISPDGRNVVLSINDLGGQVWIYDLERETLSRFSFAEEGGAFIPLWTPDGKHVAFLSGSPGNLTLQPADGSGGPETLSSAEYLQAPNSFTPDGQLLAFVEVNPVTGRDIWILSLSDRQAEPFLQTPYDEGAPVFSPDGNWLAYSSNETGRREIYVQPYPGPGGKRQISNNGGAGAGLESQRARVVLPQHRPNDGRGHHDRAEFCRRRSPASLRRQLSAHAGHVSQLRRLARRPALPDVQSPRRSLRPDANQRGAELVRGVEAPRPGAVIRGSGGFSPLLVTCHSSLFFAHGPTPQNTPNPTQGHARAAAAVRRDGIPEHRQGRRGPPREARYGRRPRVRRDGSVLSLTHDWRSPPRRVPLRCAPAGPPNPPARPLGHRLEPRHTRPHAVPHPRRPRLRPRSL